MTKRSNLIHGALAAATLLIGGLAGGPVQAQGISPSNFDANPNCAAFQRWGAGGWTAQRPTNLDIDNGMRLSFMPGDSMGPGQTIAGVAVPVILDRHCGNM